MDIKNFCKGIGMYFFAEILCLFLALTLSAIGGTLSRIISCICTIGVLLCICINYALNRSREDKKRSRPDSLRLRLFYSLGVSLIFLLLGICLLLSRGGILFSTGFYRWYKLLDAPFLQLCNFCSMDVTADTLSWGETILLACANLIPFAAVWVTYAVARKRLEIRS